MGIGKYGIGSSSTTEYELWSIDYFILLWTLCLANLNYYGLLVLIILDLFWWSSKFVIWWCKTENVLICG
ncbi:hypothetical protein RHMOL_Rhmol07G0178500 [Rhododendron molle]|uniref:Uncharacterized protein n=1 Tax=Rhododendron molle TaxID=49168 RepID=A0ACC0N1T9_RHOML|nr:hypothetical protein RHMOL_Rhmol07G0178500 [Rhododendron molle]